MSEDGITFWHFDGEKITSFDVCSDCMMELIKPIKPMEELINFGVYRINDMFYRLVDAPAEYDPKQKINWEEEGF